MKIKSLSLTLSTLAFIACGGNEQVDSLQTNFTKLSTEKSTLQRDMNPQATTLELDTLSTANNHLAFDVYRYLQQEDDKNSFASSYSVYNMLGMLSAGAEGKTKEQMLEAMYLPIENSHDIHRQFNALDMQFARTSGSFEVAIANALWVQKGVEVKEPFLDTLAQNYGASTYLLDFEKNSAGARESINKWTSEKTGGKIEELITENSFNANTKVVLTNAIHLKAKWKNSFAQQNTLYRNFTKVDDNTIQVPTMHQKAIFRHKEINGTNLLCMHYIDSEYRLLSIMPEEGKFEEFEESLDLLAFRTMITDTKTGEVNLKEKMIDLYYPKYEFENTINLVEPLKLNGMTDAFGENADFSSITNDATLNISRIIQKTFFKVDEEGTEAATTAATTLGTTSLPEMTLKFDRPFLFVLCHEPTKTILFLGRVMNPLQTE